MTKQVLNLGYVKEASINNYELTKPYDLISAKDTNLVPDSEMLKTGVDIGLMRLHIHKAPERRQWLALREDRNYEIMVTFAPVHIHGAGIGDVIKVKYLKFFNIEKEDSAGGFTYKKMFENLKFKGSLSLDISLVEIDNEKVDPEPLETLLNDTSIGTMLDLSPYNPKEYLMLASNIISKIQDVFGSDKAGDDPLWDDTLILEPKPTIPGSYRLKEGFYVILEGYNGFDFKNVIYQDNSLHRRGTSEEVHTNYLIFAVGKSLVV